MAEQSKSQFLLEQESLSKVLRRIGSIITDLEQKHKEAAAYVLELYDTYTPDESNYHIEIPAYENIRDNYKKDLEELDKSKSSPYFGKLIFTRSQNGQRKIIYLGKKSVINFEDDKEDIPIIDWRTPVAEVYYNGRIGETSYTAPMGEVNINLELKRTLKIEQSKLINIYDAEVVSNDQLLLEFLSQNKETVLNEVIATIQEEQNAIIRKSINRNVVVQGVAGSGKTTVALHRISYLLYQNRETLKGENFYLIAANSLFLGYITAMLPDLDIPVIKQATMMGALMEEISWYDEKFEKTFRFGESRKEIYSNFINAFSEYLYDLEEEIFKEDSVVLFGKYLLTNSQISSARHKTEEDLTSRAKRLDQQLVTCLKREKSYIISYLLGTKEQEETIEFIRSVFKTEPEMADDYFLNQNFSKLVNKYKNHFYARVKSLKVKKLFADFTGSKEAEYSHSDLACLLLLYNFIKANPDTGSIKHIIIDEGQDFPGAVYLCLRRVFRNATFTIVGDIMQSIRVNGLEDWEDVLQGVFAGRADFDRMLKSYRNTWQISMFAKEKAEEMSGREIEIHPFRREGNQVSHIKGSEQLLATIEDIKKRRGLNAIICKDGRKAEELYHAIKDKTQVSLLNTAENLTKGTYIVDLADSKGLEFDTVILYDSDSYEDEDYRAFYVAATRALHELYIAH